MRLDSKTAVISGAASGIGLATAQAFAEAGARVLLGAIAEDQGSAAAAAICAKGKGADFIRLDVTDPASIEAFRQEAIRPRDPCAASTRRQTARTGARSRRVSGLVPA
jgi:NAD(P)-dependent dehydrogenase (short-subunit alcohol dehydrogenase family)